MSKTKMKDVVVVNNLFSSRSQSKCTFFKHFIYFITNFTYDSQLSPCAGVCECEDGFRVLKRLIKLVKRFV